MQKKLWYASVVVCAIVLLTTGAGYSQLQNLALILIDSPQYKLLSKFPSLKNYYADDSILIAEIEIDKVNQLKQQNIAFQVIDSRGWSGEYYVLSRRPYGPALSKINIGDTIYSNEKISIVKIQPGEAELLFTAGYQLEKITPVVKPLPGLRSYSLTIPTSPDSIIAVILDRVSAMSLEAAVQRLQDFQTRYTYADSIIAAGQWIYDQYVSFGYTDVKFDTFYLDNEPHRNIIVTKPGLVYPDSVIMLGGHYDSIVFGAGTNRYVFAPGADDNASGTVAAMEAARVLADYEFEATLKFAAWDAEEVGLLGSAAYAEQAANNKEPISLYMNFDMIGNITPLYTVTIYTNEQTRPFAELTANIARLYTALTPNVLGNSGGSDHRSFQLNGYPAFFIQEGDFSPHWHKPTDVTSNMDFDYMKQVVQMGIATAVHIAGPTANISDKPYVKYYSHVIDDDTSGSSNGNANGFIDAGETIELGITLKNFGDSTSYDVTATLSTNDSYVTISDTGQSFGTIPPKVTAVNQNNFVFQVSPETPSGHKITYHLNITDSRGNNWQDRLFATVIMPDFAFHHQETKEVSGNGDDKIDPGEIFNLFIAIKNTGLRDAEGITSILRCDNPMVTILDSLANMTDIPKAGIGTNYQDGFTVEINSMAKPEIIPFALTVREGKGFVQKTINFKLAISQRKILLVEDDGHNELSYYYKEALNNIGLSYLHWDTDSYGPVTGDTLMRYNRVIWYTGGQFTNSLFRDGTNVLENYLENGGNLFINGSVFPFSCRDSLIMTQYLKSKYISFDTKLHHLKTEGMKPVLGEIDFWLSRSGDNSQSLKGEIDVQSPAEPILFYDPNTSEGAGNIQSSGAAAVAVANNKYRAVMFSFGWEGIENREIRENVLVKILNWLQGTPTTIGSNITDSDIPTTFELLQNYPNPFNSSTTIQFQLPKTSQVTIKIFNILGSEMRTLIDANLEAGNYRVVWDGKDNRDRPVASGVYFYQLTAGDFKKSRKMILLY